MRIKGLLSCAMLAATPVVAQTAAMSSNDPYLWLEDKDGARPLAWVEAENARTLLRLQGDPRKRWRSRRRPTAFPSPT